MPRARFPRRKARRGRRAHRRARKGGRVPRSVRSSPQMAKIVELAEFQDLLPNTTYALNFSLFQFARASVIAPNFKYYRATKVEWIIDPVFNTFQEFSGSLPSVGIPYLYMRMNRNQDAYQYTVQNLQSMGAKPNKFTKQIVYSYKPNWCSPGMSAYATRDGGGSIAAINTQGRKTEYAWLAAPDKQPADYTGGTQNQTVNFINGNNLPSLVVTTGMNVDSVNSTLYNGSDIFIDQTGPINQTVGRLTCRVHWEFKEPNFSQIQTSPGVETSGPAPVTAHTVSNAATVAAN